MKILFTKVVCSLFVVGLSLFIWTLLPDAKIEETYSINSNSSLFSNNTQCDKVQELMEAKYNVSFPKIVKYDNSDEILVKIEKSNVNISNSNNNYSSYCGVSLEVWVDGEGMLINPGTRIIEPFPDKHTQSFKFKIFPVKDHLEKGTIWINAVFPNENEALFERIPMFAIPFNIQSRSFFGITVRIIRIFSFSLVLLAMLSLLFKNDLNKNRK